MGGAEKVVTGLADALAEKGHDVLLAYLTGTALVLPVSPAVGIIDLGVNSVKDMIAAHFKLRKILIAFKPDVVHSHLVHANILVRLQRLHTPIPRLITTAHNVNEEGRLRMLAYRLTDRLADISTNVSDEAVAAFIEQKAVKLGRMITVHNGISINDFSFSSSARLEIRQQFGIADDCKLILAVGRLNEQKDYPNLLHALQQINTRTANFKTYIAGDGPLKPELMEMARKLGLADRVEFLGVRRDVAKLMSASDVFVLSSAWEGFPLVIGEAMACECTVVATDCGGVKEFVGTNGYLVESREPTALAAALTTALAQSFVESRALGQAARHRIQNLYSLDTAVEKWLKLYAGPL